MRRPLHICFLITLVASGTTPLCSLAGSQQAPPAAITPVKPTVETLLAEGNLLLEQNKLGPAQSDFDAAVMQARVEKNVRGEAEAHRGLGRIFIQEAKYDLAQSEIEQAVALFQTASDPLGIARGHEQMGLLAHHRGDWKAAREQLHLALEGFKAQGAASEEANVILSLSFDPEMGSVQKQELIQQALSIARQVGNKRLEGRLFQHQGDAHFTGGDFSAALEDLQRSAALLEEAGDRFSLARVWVSLGRLHRAHGYPDRAVDFYRRALKIQEEVGDQQGVIQSINAIGVAYGAMERHREALEYYQQALDLARKTGSQRLINFQLGNLANAYLNVHEYVRGAAMLEEVLAQKPDPGIAQIRYRQLSEAYSNLGHQAQALEAASRSVEIAQAGGSLEFLHKALKGRAEVKQKMGNAAEALEDVHAALDVIEKLRSRLVPIDFLKRGFGDSHQELFSLAIELHHQLHQDRQGLKIAEEGRARAFLDLLATRQNQNQTAGESTTIRRVESELKGKEKSPASAPGSSGSSLVMRGADPELKSSVSAVPLDVEHMVATAGRLHSTILSYWVATEATFVGVVRSDGTISTTRVEVSAPRLAQLVRQTWGAADGLGERGETSGSAPNKNNFVKVRGGRELPLVSRGGEVLALSEAQKKAWRELYRLLIQPVRDRLPAGRGSLLTIIPHGPLFRLSFAALLDERDRYLIETYALHYAPSAAIFQFTEEKRHPRTEGPPHYLFVAVPDGFSMRSAEKILPPLPGVRLEVAAISRELAPGSFTLLIGENARKGKVLEALREKTVIHFATHALLRDEQALNSFLALRSFQGADPAESRLTTQEIYGLDLQADLVVLSACRTGLGKITGDGIMGLTRAFFYAGTPSIIASLWDVADEPTVLLMSQFYRSWQPNRDKSRALRAAQLHLLHKLRSGDVSLQTPQGPLTLPENPVFWAGFALIGEP
jgi:CHAT domain-containing protein/tetratricopeptide (TPR) repeat protein